MLTHEGVHRVTIGMDPVYSIDALIAKFAQEKQLIFPRIAQLPFGLLHLVVRTADPPWKMTVLELTEGALVFDTLYHAVRKAEDDTGPAAEWVSPCFSKLKDSFPLRCAFEFARWAEAGLRLFLSVNHPHAQVQFWAYYDGQIYRPPFGNIFESTYVICLGHNEAQISKALAPANPDSLKLSLIIAALSSSPWNADTFIPSDVSVLNDLIRFDSSKTDLPMLPPLNPARIKECHVAANKNLADITAKIVTFI